MKSFHQSFDGSSVLVLCEQPKLLRSIAFLLEVAEIRTTAAQTAEAFGAALAEHVPDLILIDVDMACCDAYDLVRALHQDPRYGHVPFVVMSSGSEAHDLLYALDAGAADFLPKPFDAYQLMDAVREGLNHGLLERIAV